MEKHVGIYLNDHAFDKNDYFLLSKTSKKINCQLIFVNSTSIIIKLFFLMRKRHINNLGSKKEKARLTYKDNKKIKLLYLITFSSLAYIFSQQSSQSQGFYLSLIYIRQHFTFFNDIFDCILIPIRLRIFCFTYQVLL